MNLAMPPALTRTLAALALIATTAGAWAAGAAELRRLPQAPGKDSDDGDGDDDAESVEDIARKLDAHPQVRAALARQGLTSREYAAATLAALHAGMVLAVEKAPGAKSAQGLTPEQRANVELMRTRRKARP